MALSAATLAMKARQGLLPVTGQVLYHLSCIDHQRSRSECAAQYQRNRLQEEKEESLHSLCWGVWIARCVEESTLLLQFSVSQFSLTHPYIPQTHIAIVIQNTLTVT